MIRVRSGGRSVLRQAFVSPSHNPANSYTQRQIEDFEALGLAVGGMKEAVVGAWALPRSAKMLVLNWFEDRLATARWPLIEFARSLAVLCLLKVRIGHIIWIRHNLRPHASGVSDRLQRLFVALIGRLASISVSHRAVAGIDGMVVPHPLYGSATRRDAARHGVRDIPFLIPGSVRDNKGIVELFEHWPARHRLHIAGHCADPALADRIDRAARSRGIDVRWDNRFLEEGELDGLVARSSFVLLTNHADTMIVSGVFHHAASLGANILIRPGDYCDAMRSRYDFVKPLDLDRLGNLDAVDAGRVIDQIERTNGRAARLAAWTRVFDRLDVLVSRHVTRC